MDALFELLRDDRNRLVLKRPGQEDAVDVRIRRSFPWSEPRKKISVRSPDGKELLLIDDLDALPDPQRRFIDEVLADTYFIPRISRIENLDMRFQHQEWRVQTDRGPVTFRVQEREDVRFLGDGRFTVKDADGNLYELPRLNELDEHSRRMIERLL